MDEDDLKPRAATPEQKKLEMMSIEALHQYVAELEAEIARAKATIAAKGEARTAADSFFRN